jgi:2-succinyl-5-enolpyruvyl-6-hydroxy-3-cyclohexene-1-carboxylate synthase
MTPAAWNTWVGRLLVEELARLETPLVCLAPGARCAPLSMALGAMRRMPWTTFVDERAAAFHALGVGRATGRPAAVVTTSGTAVGNLVPAAMEADRAGVPLLLLTADRPAELRDTASNQTVLQADLLAPVVRWRSDLPCSDLGLRPAALLSALDQAVAMARDRRGPVHVNLQFREPLGPAEAEVPAAIAGWWSRQDPWSTVDPPTTRPSATGLARLERLAGARRGLVVVGSLPDGLGARVGALVERLGWPVVATPDAGVVGSRGVDSALADASLARRLAPDVVLWFGGHVVSKRLVHWLRDLPGDLQLVSLVPHGLRVDPAFRTTDRLALDLDALEAVLPSGAPDPGWRADWQAVDAAARVALSAPLADWSEFAAVDAVLRASRAVFVGASLPIRLVDWIGAPAGVRIDANRGASGIDGVLATGAGWARHVEGPVRVLVGDLTCLHDQGSLPLFAEPGRQLVVLNNQGGAIFGMLPFGEVAGFDRVFRNAHGTAITPMARAHGLVARQVTSRAALDEALADPAVDVVEACFPPEATPAAIAQLHRAITGALRQTWSPS